MSIKGLGSPTGKEPKSETYFFNWRSHQKFSSADGKRSTTCALIHAEVICCAAKVADAPVHEIPVAIGPVLQCGKNRLATYA
jgi:hypothetical protein